MPWSNRNPPPRRNWLAASSSVPTGSTCPQAAPFEVAPLNLVVEDEPHVVVGFERRELSRDVLDTHRLARRRSSPATLRGHSERPAHRSRRRGTSRTGRRSFALPARLCRSPRLHLRRSHFAALSQLAKPRARCPAVRLAVVEKVVRKFRTLEEADQADREYYRRMSPEQRLEILLHLLDHPLKQGDGSSERFPRVYRVAQLKQG